MNLKKYLRVWIKYTYIFFKLYGPHMSYHIILLVLFLTTLKMWNPFVANWSCKSNPQTRFGPLPAMDTKWLVLPGIVQHGLMDRGLGMLGMALPQLWPFGERWERWSLPVHTLQLLWKLKFTGFSQNFSVLRKYWNSSFTKQKTSFTNYSQKETLKCEFEHILDEM